MERSSKSILSRSLIALIAIFASACVIANLRDGLVLSGKPIASLYVTQVTDSTFQREVLAATVPVLVMFHAPWCQPCHEMMPTLDQVSKRFDDELKFVRVDGDANEFTRQKYAVERYPTLVVFDQGEEVERRKGLKNSSELEGWMREILRFKAQ